MILIGENRSTQSKTCPSATLSITNPTRTGLGLNSSLRSERPVIKHLSHGTASGFLNELACNVTAHFVVTGQFIGVKLKRNCDVSL
jgi:hypothetical protein